MPTLITDQNRSLPRRMGELVEVPSPRDLPTNIPDSAGWTKLVNRPGAPEVYQLVDRFEAERLGYDVLAAHGAAPEPLAPAAHSVIPATETPSPAASNATSLPASARYPQIQLAGPENVVDADQAPSTLRVHGTSAQVLGIPRFLVEDAAKLRDMFPQVANGSGVSLGDGFQLTARHVYENIDSGADVPTDGFTGHRVLTGKESALRMLPELGDYQPFAQGWREPVALGNMQDWALLQSNTSGGSPVRGVRPTSDVKPGEALWIIGHPGLDGLAVSAGVFDGVEGKNGMLTNTDAAPGFSGGAVVDAKGNLVGIVYSQLVDPNDASAPSSAAFMTTEAINENIKAGQITEPDLPSLLQ